jgi:hypothetical protein
MAFHEDDIDQAMRVVRGLDLPSPPATHPPPPTALCLHAGNLPLVGWHDVVSVVRAGWRYAGKLSRKDPHLGKWIRTWMPDARISADLDEFTGLRADAVLFSGSEASVPAVLDRLKAIGAVHSGTRYLIRTAHTSVAWVDSLDAGTMAALADGIARYDGQGCRSVRVVVSPFPFTEAVAPLRSAAAAFADRDPHPRNRVRKSFYESVGREVVPVGRLIATDADPLWDDDDMTVWIRGTLADVHAMADRLGTGLQQLYHTTRPISGGRWEPLAAAQTPGADWKPDGVDTVAFLRADG